MSNYDNNYEDIGPEAGNLFYALRDSGYDNVAALEDLMDNSIDADASNIRIYIDNLDKIFLADDGVGMSRETLNQAIKLGGRKDHENTNDLGKYGFGLITASISLGRRLTIITRKDGMTNTAVFDYDDIRSRNEFKAPIREATESEIVSFEFRTQNAQSGTVILIDNCDKIQYNTADELVKSLKLSVRRVFRKFMMQDGKSIYINDEILQYDDPLFLDDKRTKTRVDKVVEVQTDNGTEKLHILAVTLPVMDKATNKALHINIPNQGFYILRNNREIAAAIELTQVFKKHNDYNLLRIELHFGPELDNEMGINYAKHNIAPSNRVINAVKNALSDTVIEVRREAKERQAQAKKAQEKAKEPESGNVPEGGADDGTTKVIPKEVKIGMRFQDEKQPLFSLSLSKEKANIWYNGANSFYKNNIIDGYGGPELKKNLDLILKSIVDSCIENEIPKEVIEKISANIAEALEQEEE